MKGIATRVVRDQESKNLPSREKSPAFKTQSSIDGGGEVVLYAAPDGEVRLDVRLERESVWLTLDQIAKLFSRDKSVISRHLRNVFASRELNRKSVVAKNALAQSIETIIFKRK